MVFHVAGRQWAFLRIPLDPATLHDDCQDELVDGDLSPFPNARLQEQGEHWQLLRS